VTAEAAIGMCLLVLVALGLVWMICLGVVAVRAQDAAREAVRALARGEAQDSAIALARRAAPEGASIEAEADGHLVRAVVRAPVRGPGGIFGFLGSVTVTGRAVGAVEAGPSG